MSSTKKVAFGINNEKDFSAEPRRIISLLGDICNVIRCRDLSSIQLRKVLIDNKSKIIVHYTVSGYAGTPFEPKTPHPAVAYKNLQAFINEGFPPQQIVLRIDPIIPTEKGLEVVNTVLEVFQTLNIKRCRYKMFLYPKELSQRAALQQAFPLIGGNPYASVEYGKVFYSSGPHHRRMVKELLEKWTWHYRFETCDKDDFVTSDDAVPCISVTDLQILGWKNVKLVHDWKSKNRCHCPIGTIELSTKTNTQCAVQCMHCRHKTEIK